MDEVAVNPQYLHNRHAERIGPDRGADTENTQLLVTMPGLLHKQVRSKPWALMEIEKHDNALSCPNVFKPFLVLLVNEYRAFRI